MKKNKKTLLVLSCVLLVLVVALLSTKLITQKTEKIKETGDSILSLTEDELTQIYISYSSASYTFEKNDDGVWYYTGDEAMPIDQESFKELLSYFENVYAGFEIDDVEDYSQYGLSSPRMTVQLATEERKYTMTVGNNSNADSLRYITNGDSNVYLAKTDPYELFKIVPTDYIDLEEIPSYTTLVSLAVEKENDPLTIIYKEDSGYCYSDEYVYYIQEGSSYLQLDTSLAKTYVGKFTNLSLSSYVSYTASDDGLSTYGLDDPAMTVTLTYLDSDKKEQSLKMLMTEKSDSFYCMIEGSELVYYMASSSYDALLEGNYEDLKPEELVLLDWDEVSSLVITLDGEEYSYKLDGSEKDAEGEKISFSDIEDALDGVEINEYTVSAADKKYELGLKLSLKNGQDISLDFYKYDADSCLVTWNSSSYALVSRSETVTLIEACNSVVLK